MPVIALLSDFGLDDHYVGTMKGVILGIAPEATLVDLTHGIEAQDILCGALQLAAAYRYFPADTIFMAIVDPGVGSGRRAIAARAGGFTFVAPDNGILSAVFDDTPPEAIVELLEPRYALPSVSRTFEGRDRFAPAAAWLARGTALPALGPARGEYVRLTIPRPVVTDDELAGEVLLVDRFGNLVSNITRNEFDAFARGHTVAIGAGSLAAIPLASSYSEMPDGQVCAILGSTGRIELSLKTASAAARLGAGRGLPVSVRRGRF